MTLADHHAATRSTLLIWTSHVDEETSDSLGRRCYFYTARSADTAAGRSYSVVQAADTGDLWSAQVTRHEDGGPYVTSPLGQRGNVDEAQALAQRDEDATYVDVDGFVRQPYDVRAGLRAVAEQRLADAHRQASVLMLAEVSVLIRNLSDRITHVHIAAAYEGDDIAIVRFVDAASVEVDVWDDERAPQFELIRSFLKDAFQMASGYDFLLFTFRDPAGAERTTGVEHLGVDLFPAN